jgi:hypothetical protein
MTTTGSRFEGCAMNPSHARQELDAEELDKATALLGNPNHPDTRS